MSEMCCGHNVDIAATASEQILQFNHNAWMDMMEPMERKEQMKRMKQIERIKQMEQIKQLERMKQMKRT